MTVPDAVRAGFVRWRSPNWRFPNCYIRLDAGPLNADGERTVGPMAHLFSPDEQRLIGVETPQSFYWPGHGATLLEGMEPYTGPIAAEDTEP